MKNGLIYLLASLLVTACDPYKKSRSGPVRSTPEPVVTSVPVSNQAVNIAWLDSERLMPVLEMANEQHKPVFVVFFASWCAPCKVMEEEVFPQTDVFTYLNNHFLNFHTDFDSPAGRTIADIYEVTQLPTVLFLDPQGIVLERHVGMAVPSLLNTMGNSALEKMKR